MRPTPGPWAYFARGEMWLVYGASIDGMTVLEAFSPLGEHVTVASEDDEQAHADMHTALESDHRQGRASAYVSSGVFQPVYADFVEPKPS